MQVKKLNEYIGRYKQYLQDSREVEGIYPWETLKHFQTHWDVAAADFGDMFHRSLQNSHSQRLWKREAWYPKEIMAGFIEMEVDFVRAMFRELMDESVELKARASRFVYCCDELLKDLQLKPGKSKEDAHFHSDHQMLFTYLSFRYPEQYSLFDYPSFEKTLLLLETRSIPKEFEITRFVKLCNAMYTFLKKDPEVWESFKAHLDTEQHYMEESKVLVYHFYSTCPQLS